MTSGFSNILPLNSLQLICFTEMQMKYKYLNVQCSDKVKNGNCKGIQSDKFYNDSCQMCKEQVYGDICCRYCKKEVNTKWNSLMMDEIRKYKMIYLFSYKTFLFFPSFISPNSELFSSV